MFAKQSSYFCPECRQNTTYEVKKVSRTYMMKDKEYSFKITTAFCNHCGEEIILPGLLDFNVKEIDQQYREIEHIISIDDINKLMKLYNLGKSTLSLALGFGEITITRYLLGQVPSKEYSDIMKKALESPEFMLDKLNCNRYKIGEKAYKKAKIELDKLIEMFAISNDLLSTISYLFEKMSEITPLALQKLLYFIQGFSLAKYNKPMFTEDCYAWVHGPVFDSVYNLFKNFKYNPIDDNRFAILKNRFHELTVEEKDIVDLVVETFGLYSGKVLEIITHKEDPWLNARGNLCEFESSNNKIEKSEIKKYFCLVNNTYDLNDKKEIRKYIYKQLDE